MERKDFVGARFNHLIVVSEKIKYKYNRKVECLCDCGNKCIVSLGNLKNNHTKSCGCIRIKMMKKNKTTHNFSKTRFYSIWSDINTRCSNRNQIYYSRYGGRGIKCLWKSFEEFRDDMYESYNSHIQQFGEKNTSIDRIDNNGNYCKENCRWATQEEQQNNTSKNIYYKFKGEKNTISNLAKKYGINRNTLRTRIHRNWSVEKALTTPVA